MRIWSEDFVIGREQDRGHQDKRNGQFGNECDGVAVNAGYGGSVTDCFVPGRALQQKRSERHA